MLPPWPGWDGLHPLIIHFPIVLVLVAPIFVVLAMLRPARFLTFTVPALILLALGTIAAFVAVATGEAAAEMVTRTDAIDRVLDGHAELAETTRLLLAVVTVLYAGVVLALMRFKALARPVHVVASHGLLLVLLLGTGLMVARVAHQGGVLVHGLGVHAMVQVPQAQGGEPGRER